MIETYNIPSALPDKIEAELNVTVKFPSSSTATEEGTRF